jgi:hypothetical protein
MEIAMKKIVLTLSCIACFATMALAQQGKYNLQGTVTDTLGSNMSAATVLLQNASDSTLIEFAITTDEGHFAFKKLDRIPYLLKITYMGYLPKDLYIAPPEAGNALDLGKIAIVPIAEELMEVVIKTAKAPMSIRGDTIEYDASTFKVPPGSTVEDLLRRLPGMEVTSDGSITSQGNTVSKVTVDGKNFFGGDPKQATKNLPAEGISKVSVFDTQTEQSKLTGEKPSGPPDKTMNLELKEEFKKGGFGKLVVGGGTESRAEVKGNYNKFNEKQQFSLVGNLNNTGRNGLSWNDYQEFRGSQTFNWADDGDFGFGSSSRSIRFGGGSDDDAEEIGLGQGFFGGSNQGIPKNYSGGINYNYEHNKKKFSGVYFYTQTGLETDATRYQENFLTDINYFRNDASKSRLESINNRVELEWNQEIDSQNVYKYLFINKYRLFLFQKDGTKIKSNQIDRAGTLGIGKRL